MDWVLKQSFNHFLKAFCEPLQEDGLQLSFVDGLVVRDLILRPEALNGILEANDTDLRIEGGRIGLLRMCYTAVPGVVTLQMSDLDLRVQPNAFKTIGKTLRDKLTDLVTGVPEDPPLSDQEAYAGGWVHQPTDTYYHHLPTCQQLAPPIANDYTTDGHPRPQVLNTCGDPNCRSPHCQRPVFLHNQHPHVFHALHQKPLLECDELQPRPARKHAKALCGFPLDDCAGGGAALDHYPPKTCSPNAVHPPFTRHPYQHLPPPHARSPSAPLCSQLMHAPALYAGPPHAAVSHGWAPPYASSHSGRPRPFDVRSSRPTAATRELSSIWRGVDPDIHHSPSGPDASRSGSHRRRPHGRSEDRQHDRTRSRERQHRRPEAEGALPLTLPRAQ